MSVSCIVCNSDKWIERKEHPKAWRTTNEIFSLHQCATCGLIKTHPLVSKEQIGLYYNLAQYDSHKNSGAKSLFDYVYKLIQKVNHRSKWNAIKSALKQSFDRSSDKVSILDYGCGNGAFLQFVSEKFQRVRGVEFAPEMIAYCNAKGIEVLSESEFYSTIDCYEVITLFHVFEHLYEPERYLKHFNKHLKKNGILLIAVPNPESYDAKYYSSDWAAWDVPIHVYHFKEQTLIRLVEKYGFKFRQKKPMLFDAFYVSILSEKNKKTKLGIIRGALFGLLSNILALFTGQYSSKMYIFEKITEIE
ncbi:methyltransferase [Thermaurantimonas aggregans]|uniref:Methyltransferase n=1 Tax=Thermaurantimonas aggregans TaxID=2173829 RepID=A0A401XMP8_9FLAO|nr:class I SAM-dependent methyltransferase [Thermaurantimonas aggregans]GCD78295.1 methyltransferase [Thermaurantimonas aggregans]